jgi:hypothetical protein
MTDRGDRRVVPGLPEPAENGADRGLVVHASDRRHERQIAFLAGGVVTLPRAVAPMPSICPDASWFGSAPSTSAKMANFSDDEPALRVSTILLK